MANLYIYRIESTSCRVQWKTLIQVIAKVEDGFEIFRGSSLIDYYTITLDDRYHSLIMLTLKI